MGYKLILFLLVLVIGIGLDVSLFPVTSTQHDNTLSSYSASMKITSTAFQNMASIPSVYTCDGKNINPPLAFSDIPPETKSLVLFMDDPDVPPQAGVPVWDHWVVYNIPPTVIVIEEGKNPEGIMGKNTRGDLAYGGPCPPDREHRYFFKLYALDTMLSLSAGATKKEVEIAIQGHILATGELVGLYNRK